MLHALAVACEEPGFATALVTDESWLSDFGVTKDEYPRIAEQLGIDLDPESAEDNVLYQIAAKLKGRECGAATSDFWRTEFT